MSIEWVSRAEAAQILKVSPPRIDQLKMEKRLEANADGALSLVSIRLYEKERQGKKAATKWKRMGEKYKAKHAKLKHEIEAGQYVLSSQVRQELGTAFDTTRQRLLEIPSAVATSLIGITDPETIREKLEEQIRQALSSIAEKASAMSASVILCFVFGVLAPPKELSVSEWAAENRILNKKTSAFPGRWINDRTPYAVGIMDAFSDPSVETIVLKAASQVVKTEALLNCIGYCIDTDPGPAMVVYPREEDAETVAINRLHPLIEDCPSLKARLSSRPTIAPNECRFDRMTLWLAASNSPAALASKPIRYLFLDEVNKFPMFSGKEADPVKLSMERTKTFWNRKHVLCSTPTTEHGYISREYEQSNKHSFFLPCPACGAMDKLDFKNLRWPVDVEPRIIKRDRLAWYECPHCQHKWNDGDKQAMLGRGEWRSDKPREGRRQVLGFHLSSMYARWISFSDVAAEFLTSQEDPALEMNFVNSWLGEDWKDVKRGANADEIAKRTEGIVEGQLPPDTAFIVGACDVQQHHVWAAVFAFTRTRRVYLVRFRRVDGEGSTARAISRAYEEIFDEEYVGSNADGEPFSFRPRRVAIDSGYATDEVYAFCLRHSVCIPFKGRETESMVQPWSATRIDRFPDGKPMPSGLMLYIVSSGFWREHVLRAYTRPIDEPGAWLVHEQCGIEYTKHVTSWAKRVEKKKNGRIIESWHQLKKDDHGLDCAQYAAALGDILGAKHLKTEPTKKPKYGVVGKAF